MKEDHGTCMQQPLLCSLPRFACDITACCIAIAIAHLPIEPVSSDDNQLGTKEDSVRIVGAVVQAAFKAEQEAALKKAEVAKDLPGAFTDTASPGVRTRSQARKML